MLDVCLLGTGGMMPLPGRWLTSLITRLNGSSLLIDCGEGTQIAMKEKGISPHSIDTICFTHYHGDHIGGLPGLLLSMGNGERTKKVTLMGPRGLERVVESLRVIAPELPFDLEYIEYDSGHFKIALNGYEINAFKVNHNITCYGYCINVRRQGKFSVEKAKEKNVPLRLWSRLQRGEVVEMDGRSYTPEMVVGPERKGIKLVYVTDTRPVRAIAEYAKNADLFICEGMYGEKEKQGKAREHKHMTFYEAAQLARMANPREMWLTHFSPSMVRPQQYLRETQRIFHNTQIVKDGKMVTLEFEKEDMNVKI